MIELAVKYSNRNTSKLKIVAKICPHIGIDPIIDLRIVV